MQSFILISSSAVDNSNTVNDGGKKPALKKDHDPIGGGKRRRRPSELDERPRKRVTINNPAALHSLELPLELWFEIFCLLYPIDLLHLSRTCKLIRGWLTHDVSVLTWKSASLSIETLTCFGLMSFAGVSESALSDLGIPTRHRYRPLVQFPLRAALSCLFRSTMRIGWILTACLIDLWFKL